MSAPLQMYLRISSARLRAGRPLTAWEERNPHVYEAYIVLKQALRLGWLKRQPCEVCGVSETDAHHDDYSKPLAVRWLCRTHHRRHHASFREAVA